MGSFDVVLDDERTQLDAFAEEYRSALETSHMVQQVWFEESVGGTSRRELGLVQSPDESFQLADDDTVASVTAAHREACARARAAVTDLPLVLQGLIMASLQIAAVNSAVCGTARCYDLQLGESGSFDRRR